MSTNASARSLNAATVEMLRCFQVARADCQQKRVERLATSST